MKTMDDERQKNVDFSQSSSPKYLFPIPSHSSTSAEGYQKPALLFPCVVEKVETEKSQGTEANLSWLTNQSYNPEDQKGKTEYETPTVVISEDDEITEKIEEEEDVVKERENKRHQHDKKRSKKHSKKRKYSDNEISSSDDSVKRSKHKKKNKKRKHKKRVQSESDSDEKDKVHKPDTIWIEDSGLSLEEAYRIHHKPDIENLMYGSLYRLDVAMFKIKQNTQCLGLDRRYNIKGDNFKKNKKKNIESRYWKSTETLSENPELIKPSTKSTKFFVGNIENYAYLPLDLPSKRENEKESEIKGKEKERDNEGTVDSNESFMTQRTAELNKTLRENPHDVKKWIELVEFQTEAVSSEDLGRPGYSASGNERKKNNSKVIKEKQISVLEKALEENPSSIELITYHLELCSDLWEDNRLMEKWRKVVFAFPNKAVLWRKYLSFVQSRFSTFTFRRAQKIYDKCFTTLLSIKEGTFVSHQPEEGIEDDMLDLFVQHCKFMKQSGHMEKAFACFQAMVELNCLCPSELSESTPTSGQLAFLETFWDSGKSRFGEDGAVGWNTWMDKSAGNKKPLGLESLDLKKIFKAYDPTKVKDNEVPTAAEKEEQMVKGLPKWKAWLKVEVSRDNTQLKPWQPDTEKGETEDDCEDPEKLVVFDDISSYLFKLKNMDNKFKLILHFLEILGVPLDPSSSTQSFETQRYFELSIQTAEQLMARRLFFPIHGTGMQKFEFWQQEDDRECNIKLTQERLQIVRNIFLQSLSLFRDNYGDYLSITWLLYEFDLSQIQESEKSRRQAFKEVYKLAKAILKEPSNRNNLALWQVFANVLAMSGDVAEARRVFDSAISMGSQLVQTDEEKKNSLVSLYRTYAELELKETVKASTSLNEKTSHNRVLHLLVSFTEGGKYEPACDGKTSNTIAVSSARILKAKKFFTEHCENAIQRINSNNLSNGSGGNKSKESKLFLQMETSVHVLVCCALFAYASSGIQAASSVYEKVFSSLSSVTDGSSLMREHLWTSYLSLLSLRTIRETIPLKTVRVAVHNALKEFPENPYFLDYFLQVESKSNLTGEVRRFFDYITTRNAKSPVPWIYAIHYESMRSKALVTTMDCTEYVRAAGDQSSVLVTSLPSTGISHRQRALFDRATTSTSGRQCIALWKMYIEFELQQGNKEQAKAIFYQALQHCPWAKTLYLDAVKAFPEDLQSTIDLMDEKELRVRTPLEEIEILMENEQTFENV